jgi:hypothetical protein
MAPEPSLAAADLGWLADAGRHAANAPPEHRDVAIRAAVELARHFRRHAGWGEIALAMGTTPDMLREWRSENSSRAKAGDLTPHAVPPPHDHRPGTTLMVATGHPQARSDVTNDFTTETAMIRDRCQRSLVVKELAGAGVHEITHVLDEHEPAVLHLAAHSHHGEVFLTENGTPVGIVHSLVATSITRAQHLPALVILNFCGSIAIDRSLSADGCITVAWPGTVDDQQCRAFNHVLYGRLADGRTIGTAFDDATITMARWPELLKPRLLGDRTYHLVPPHTIAQPP